jgi:hypothetical protein
MMQNGDSFGKLERDPKELLMTSQSASLKDFRTGNRK